jgi:putative heme-binding domain-containing protein
MRFLLGGAWFSLLLSTFGVAQEHSYAPSDIENGRGLYLANCQGCHGDNGNSVEGVNLGSGRFRRASTDEDLIALIRGGIPNTLMIARPQFSYAELRSVVAFLRSMQTGGVLRADEQRDVTIGDINRGEALFYGKVNCISCHGIHGGGSVLYQDLGGIGALRTPASLEDSLMNPNKEVREGERFYQITTYDGERIEGKLLNQDRHFIQMLTMQEQLLSIPTDELADKGFIRSPMPSYADQLSAAEISDLVAFMLSLKE